MLRSDSNLLTIWPRPVSTQSHSGDWASTGGQCGPGISAWGSTLQIVTLSTLCFYANACGTICESDDDDRDEVRINEPYYLLNDQQFERLMLRGSRIESIRQQMENRLTNELHAIGKECSLTGPQLRKLRLAGYGDIVRFFDQVTDLRRKYVMVAMNQQRFSQVNNELRVLSNVPQMLAYRETSLFRKSLRTTLTDEQLAKYQLAERQRMVIVVELALKNWESHPTGVKLAEGNRQQFIETLVNYGRLPHIMDPYFQFIVGLEVARLEDRLKPLLSDSQWQRIQVELGNARQIEPTLRQLGHWPAPTTNAEDEPSDATKE